MLTAGVCEAATPIIDLKASKSPLINVGSKPNFLKESSSKNVGDLDSLYFDPEPELSAKTDKFINYKENSFYRPRKRFSLNLRNVNTSETYSYRIKAEFFGNELNYDVLDYFFRDWRENKTIKMDLLTNFVTTNIIIQASILGLVFYTMADLEQNITVYVQDHLYYTT